MTREFIDFVNNHKDEDTAKLLLAAARYPSVDMPAAVQQIEGLRVARDKWPSLLQCEDYLYPPRINREQASSEATARYKAYLLSTNHIIDLTGGMGIDTMAFARVSEHVDYVERDPQLCTLMEHNLKVLGIYNVSVHCADSMQWLSQLQTINSQLPTLYIDPARRAASGRKVAAFEDCQPNILEHADMLRAHTQRFVVKASPMIDIDLACRQLGDVAEVHIVGVKGECKEVLFICGPHESEPVIHCVDLKVDQEPLVFKDFSFTRGDEASAEGHYCQAVRHYLYEPNAMLMKGGPFKQISSRLGLEQLGRNTHLYTSDEMVSDFPGRTFEVICDVKLGRKELQHLIPEGRAHVLTRNYPVEAAALQRQLGFKEGGELFVVATTVGSRRCGFLCKM